MFESKGYDRVILALKNVISAKCAQRAHRIRQCRYLPRIFIGQPLEQRMDQESEQTGPRDWN
jgi:hypothetical protein